MRVSFVESIGYGRRPYSQYMDKRQMLKFPANTVVASTWEDVIKLLQARHKGDARVAVYPYAAIQHMETKLDEPDALA